MWESRVLRRAFERLELHEGKLSRAVLRGGGGGDVTSLPDTWVGNHPGLPGPRSPHNVGVRDAPTCSTACCTTSRTCASRSTTRRNPWKKKRLGLTQASVYTFASHG